VIAPPGAAALHFHNLKVSQWLIINGFAEENTDDRE
jgi:hypothetical protein